MSVSSLLDNFECLTLPIALATECSVVLSPAWMVHLHLHPAVAECCVV